MEYTVVYCNILWYTILYWYDNHQTLVHYSLPYYYQVFYKPVLHGWWAVCASWWKVKVRLHLQRDPPNVVEKVPDIQKQIVWWHAGEKKQLLIGLPLLLLLPPSSLLLPPPSSSFFFLLLLPLLSLHPHIAPTKQLSYDRSRSSWAPQWRRRRRGGRRRHPATRSQERSTVVLSASLPTHLYVSGHCSLFRWYELQKNKARNQDQVCPVLPHWWVVMWWSCDCQTVDQWTM